MRLGVLDVGSNTVHLLVVDAHRGGHPTPMSATKAGTSDKSGDRRLQANLGFGADSQTYYSQPARFEPDRWRHVAFTYDGAGVGRFYLDGRTWGGGALSYHFGLPPGTPAKRWIEDGCLPLIHAQGQRQGIRYTQTAFAPRLEPGGLGYPDMRADDTTVLVVRILCENTGDKPAGAALGVAIQADGRTLPLTVRDSRVYATADGRELLRCEVLGPAGERWQAQEGGKRIGAVQLQGQRGLCGFHGNLHCPVSLPPVVPASPRSQGA